MAADTTKHALQKLVLPAALLIFTSLYFYDAVNAGAPIRNGMPTATFFPILLSILMFVLVSATIWKEIILSKGSGVIESANVMKVASSIFAVSAYIFAFEAIGYFISTIIFSIVMMIILQAKIGIKYVLRAVIVSVLCTALIYMLFTFAFRVRLPTPFVF